MRGRYTRLRILTILILPIVGVFSVIDVCFLLRLIYSYIQFKSWFLGPFAAREPTIARDNFLLQ